MKKDIHPEYTPTKITCGCGEVIETRSTRKDISVEICSKCHPFFTGKQKFVDTAGRVEKFQRRYAWTDDSAKKAVASKAGAKAKAEATEPEEAPQQPAEKPAEQPTEQAGSDDSPQQ